jgi:hypothetical protein
MAELHEGGDPKEFNEFNGQKLEEMKQQKKSQHSDTQVQEVTSIPAVFGILLFLFVCYSVIGPETKRSNGVVKSRDDKNLIVQDLKDTTLYNVFNYDDKMLVDEKRAFPHITAGDTLTYVLPENMNMISFSAARKVNGQSMAKFAKKRQQIAESAKIRNSLNQKTK